jgi:3-oxoacyl-[acyl-carrier protein] reductase
MDLGLEGRVAIVAAASTGLGRAVAEELAKEGCQLAICSHNTAKIEKAAAEISKLVGGREILARNVDVGDAAQVTAFVAEAEKKFGRVDICVTNGGGPPPKKFLEISDQDWRDAVDSTLLSAVNFSRATLPIMQRGKWGRLITITSTSVKQPLDGLMLSNSIRAAVTGMAKTLASEFGPFGITVNNVCPGFTATARLEELFEKRAQAAGTTVEEIAKQSAAQIPIGRIARPDEFAAVVTFLASERASAVNGVTIAVDGGMLKGLF